MATICFHRIRHRGIYGQKDTDEEEPFLGHSKDCRTEERRRRRRRRRWSLRPRRPLAPAPPPHVTSRSRPWIYIWPQHPVRTRHTVWWPRAPVRPRHAPPRYVQPRTGVTRHHVQSWLRRWWRRSPAQSHGSRRHVVWITDGPRLGPHAPTNRKRRKYLPPKYFVKT